MKVVRNITKEQGELLVEITKMKLLAPLVIGQTFAFEDDNQPDKEYTFPDFLIWAIENGKLAVKCNEEEAAKVCEIVPNSENNYGLLGDLLCKTTTYIWFCGEDSYYHKLTNHTLPAADFLKFFDNRVERGMAALEKGIKNSRLNENDLLEEAKKRYPIGTKFKGMIIEKEYVSDGVFIEIDNCINMKSNDVTVYYKGIWAQIIEPTESGLCNAKPPVLAEFEPTEQRKLIGYLPPFEMYGGGIKKDTLFKKDSVYANCYSASYDTGVKFVHVTLPSELVEAYFTPVYEKTEAELQAEIIDEMHNDYMNGKIDNIGDYFKQQTKFKIVKNEN